MKPFNSSTLLRPLTDAELQLEAPEWEDDDKVNLERVIQDYRKRFSGFQPAEPTTYQKEVSRVITTLLPAWLQFRNTFVPLKNKKEENR